MSTIEIIEKTSNFNLHIFPSKAEAGAAAAVHGAAKIREAISERGEANIVVATGASQFEMFAQLVMEPDINWYQVTAFHLDEYVDLAISHPGSFRRYLWERFYSQLPMPLRAFYFLNGEGDSEAECERVGKIILDHPIDVAFVGIGENGHLAFNDPPADFHAKEPFQVVELDRKCRLQQYNEGWFKSFESVPRRAITMTISQIMKSSSIVCTVLEERKAVAVKEALGGNLSPECPASILCRHNKIDVYLDVPAASLLIEGN